MKNQIVNCFVDFYWRLGILPFSIYVNLNEMARKVKIINQSFNALPEYKTMGSSGMDVRAHTDTKIYLKPLERSLIKTGLFLEMETGI